MNEDTSTDRIEDAGSHETAMDSPADRPEWTTPVLEDVSDQVMAQPYIRFS
jgi:hypothetical protein